MGKFLRCHEYSQWERMFGDRRHGYSAGEMLVDYFMRNGVADLREAFDHCRRAGNSQRDRSLAFANYIENHRLGGNSRLKTEWEKWVIDRADFLIKEVTSGNLVIPSAATATRPACAGYHSH